jgi:ABC-type nitrate/sulfonate/bicarbonate transport system permease component
MAETGRLSARAAPTHARVWPHPVTLVRIAIILFVLVIWQGLALSGWLYRDVVPRLEIIVDALWKLLTHPEHVRFDFLFWTIETDMPQYYANLWATASEVGMGLAIGGTLGLVVGLALGANKLMARAFEAYLYYLGPTPKIIFFPVMIMWFGVGPGSKVAMGAISCFFPIALSTAAGMRQIDQVLIRVGKSFRCNTWQMVTKIYLPAMRHPIINGVRLGLGVAIIGTLLAELKLSNRGIGFLIIQAYSLFDMPRMYAMLIVLFVLAIGVNALVGRLGGLHTIRRS